MGKDRTSWWRHQMEPFSSLLALCAGNSPVTGEFPSQRPVMRGFDVFFHLCLNKRLSKQSWGWWFETPSHSLWRHCNVVVFCSDEVPTDYTYILQAYFSGTEQTKLSLSIHESHEFHKEFIVFQLHQTQHYKTVGIFHDTSGICLKYHRLSLYTYKLSLDTASPD